MEGVCSGPLADVIGFRYATLEEAVSELCIYAQVRRLLHPEDASVIVADSKLRSVRGVTTWGNTFIQHQLPFLTPLLYFHPLMVLFLQLFMGVDAVRIGELYVLLRSHLTPVPPLSIPFVVGPNPSTNQNSTMPTAVAASTQPAAQAQAHSEVGTSQGGATTGSAAQPSRVDTTSDEQGRRAWGQSRHTTTTADSYRWAYLPRLIQKFGHRFERPAWVRSPPALTADWAVSDPEVQEYMAHLTHSFGLQFAPTHPALGAQPGSTEPAPGHSMGGGQVAGGDTGKRTRQETLHRSIRQCRERRDVLSAFAQDPIATFDLLLEGESSRMRRDGRERDLQTTSFTDLVGLASMVAAGEA